MNVNITQLGKYLTYALVVLSLAFAAWALGVYTQRIEWDKRLADQQKVIREQGEGPIGVATNRLLIATRDVQRLEKQRPEDQAWYAEQLKLMDVGNQPVKVLAYDKGLLKTDQTGRPFLQDVAADKDNPNAQPLQSRKALEDAYADTLAKTQDEMKKIDGLAKEEQKLTQTLIGDGMQAKGLRGELAQQQEKRLQSLKEQGELEWKLYNRQEEVRLATKRQHELETRKQELQGTRVTTRRP
jgi:hypothetical protein